MSEVSIRPLRAPGEFAQTLAIQRSAWPGVADLDTMPPAQLACTVETGGQVFGAFDGARLVAFLVAAPGIKPGGAVYLHSAALGVLEEYRGRGIGRALKFAQREEALRRGFRRIEWTFDPLKLSNAYFSLERLGGVVRRYEAGFFGDGTSFQADLPTDRCVAEWRLDGDRARAAAAGRPIPHGPFEACVEIPVHIEALRKDRLEEARTIQAAVREQFRSQLARGLAATGFERPGTYLFSQCHSE
jgi:predicted GNAT superfamily acetyltransferase